MLDSKLLREQLDQVREKLRHRNEDISGLDRFTELDVRRRKLLQESESLKNRRNTVSQEVARKKRQGESADDLIEEMRRVGEQIKHLDEQLRDVQGQLDDILLTLPNVPHDSVPVGESEEDNVPVRYWGEKPDFSFTPKPHWELGVELGLLDFERAAKVTGSRYVFYRGLGARLERALINFMLDLHTSEHGYEEMFPPFIVNRHSLLGTGQLPKFEEDVFRIAEHDDYLIPTAEVPVTNFFRDEILSADQLPMKFAAYSACFRSEAGAAGRDTRGLIRMHQFNKVELVKFVEPQSSYDELERLVNDAEQVLQRLGLPYRVVLMCTGDLGFTAAKKYDLEVWLPASGQYREISSCSNFESFQARRANIRYRPHPKAKPEFVHTLNGSGLAIGRTVAAILENYQQEDGSVVVPEALRPYMNGVDVIRPR